MSSQTTKAPTRMKRKTIYIAATLISIVVYTAFVLLSRSEPWLIWPAIGVALLSVVFACFWMIGLDEAAQQAHYISWFWGGSAGLLVAMLALVAVVLRPGAFEPFLGELGLANSFAAGIVVGLIPPTIGYAIWWVVLWLRRG